MKNSNTILILLLFFVLHTSGYLFGQNQQGGGSQAIVPSQSCLSPSQRTSIQKYLGENIRSLSNQGRLLPISRQAVQFILPLQKSEDLDDPGFFGISNYVDHASNTGQVRDYNCGTRSYDTSSGYNHKGTDFFTFPFGWDKMDKDQVMVIAAAPGMIIGKIDGNDDKSCSFNGRTWNAVYVRHDDGSQAWYGHLKEQSLTHKQVGERVAAGEYLGVVGSSGNSTGPHLHLEVYDTNGQLVDPYQGDCNSASNTSWWIDQEPYYNSEIVALKTHPSAPNPYGCYEEQTLLEQESYNPGQTIYFASYYRDQLGGQVSQHQITRPDGSIWKSWTQSASTTHYNSSYWWRSHSLPSQAERGRWRHEVQFNGKTYEQFFWVGPISVCNDSFEPNDTYFTAKSLEISTRSIEGLCSASDDEDWFSFEIAGVSYFLSILSEGNNSSSYMLNISQDGTLLEFEGLSNEASNLQLFLSRLNQDNQIVPIANSASDGGNGSANVAYNFSPNLSLNIQSTHFQFSEKLLQIDGSVQNFRHVSASAFSLAYYLSEDATFSAATSTMILEERIQGLGLDEAASHEIHPEIDLSPYSLNPSDYYLFILVDLHDEVEETDENDNIFRSEQPEISISPLPCYVPNNLASTVDNRGVNLEWDSFVEEQANEQFTLRYKPIPEDGWNEVPHITSKSYYLSELHGGMAYEWQVRSECESSNSEYSPSATFQTIDIRIDTVVLNPGWNLISIDVMPEDPSVIALTQSLRLGNLDFIHAFQNGQSSIFNPNGLPELNTLHAFEPGYGYWMKLQEKDTLIVEGISLADYPIPASIGLNILACLADTSAHPLNYYQEHSSQGLVDYIVGFDMGNQFYGRNQPSFINTLTEVRNGFGYWVSVIDTSANNRQVPPQSSTSYMFCQGQIIGATKGEHVELVREDGTIYRKIEILQNGLLPYVPLYGQGAQASANSSLLKYGEKLGIRYKQQLLPESIEFLGNKSLRQFNFELSSPLDLAVFPNPFLQHITIDLSTTWDKEVMLTILDIQGRTISQKTNAQLKADGTHLSWDLSHLNSGIYFLEVKQAGINKRIIKVLKR